MVGLASLALLAGCASGASPSSAPASPSPSSAVVTPAASLTPPSAPIPSPTVVVTRDLAYESSNPEFEAGELDTYAPAKTGPWPVVVMLHGGPTSDPVADRGLLNEHARRVADLGFVVFNASWGTGMPFGAPTYDQLLTTGSQAACAIEFARAHAAEYGGDPTPMVVFGHSAGASTASMVAFARSEPSAGCLERAPLGEIDALVTWDGEWLAQTTFVGWDERLASDARVFDALTPWTDLPEHTDLKVVMVSETEPNADADYDRPLPDPEAADAFFAPRDPSGVLRRQLEANGALADGNLDLFESQQLLFSVLQAQGNPVSLDILPGSNHTTLSEAGWDVFLAAFPKAAAQD
jgi:dienelactone hydrolase